MSNRFLFSSESVSEGHPDKVADQISDAVLDAIMNADKGGRVACETLVSTGLVVMSGEITTHAHINYRELAQETIQRIGYDDSDIGFDYKSCAIIIAINRQSADIAQGVDRKDLDQGAGDQGLMFGYACDETPTLMPFAIHYAHRIMERQALLRKNGKLKWLRPDAKSQITVVYEDGVPKAVDTVVVSTQHTPDISNEKIREAVIEEIIKPVIPANMMQGKITYHINPTGRFVIGGPHGDCGLTGRKIIVDSYGGSARHGGGAFSGKDPSKVDRSAAYACRYVAKNIVKAGLAKRCEVQVAYAIGVAKPVSLSVNCFDTEVIPEEKIIALIEKHFDLRPRGIIQSLDLLRPIYGKTAAYGHFGREEPEFSWEKTDKAELLRAEAGLK